MTKMKTAAPDRQKGMTLLAVMFVMAVTAIALLAVAPTVYQDVQREKELEAIRRGEEVAEAIKQYVLFYNGAKLPESMDDLLDGLPAGTKKRQILRKSAAIDPLSEDGRWRLIKVEPKVIAAFAKRVQDFNNGVLPTSPPGFEKYSVVIVNSLNTQLEDDADVDYDEGQISTDNTPFIGVASQSTSRSVIDYYGISKHSKWMFTPLFRGTTGNTHYRFRRSIRRRSSKHRTDRLHTRRTP